LDDVDPVERELVNHVVAITKQLAQLVLVILGLIKPIGSVHDIFLEGNLERATEQDERHSGARLQPLLLHGISEPNGSRQSAQARLSAQMRTSASND